MTADVARPTTNQDRSIALRIEDVHLQFRAHRGATAHPALDGVTLMIHEGERVALLGPNASGKTTLFHAICGLLQPDRGEIAVFDDEASRGRLRHLGVVFQTNSLDPHLTVRENLRDHARLYGIESAAIGGLINEALSAADLADRADEPVRRLSGGLARRADLCRALLPRPRLLLLDEPTVGLDPASREQFLRSIEDAQRRHGMTIVMSTHMVDEADRQDRAILMHHGRIVADDAPAALRRQLGSALLTILDVHWQPPDLERDRWREVSGTWRRAVSHDGDNSPTVIASRLIEGGVPFTYAPPTLADVFAHLTGTSLEARVQSTGGADATPEPDR